MLGHPSCANGVFKPCRRSQRERSLRRGPYQRPGIMWSTAPLESPWFVDFDGIAPHKAEFERAMIRERTSAGIAAARAEGRVGGRRKKLDAAKRREIAESVITGRKSGAEMARLYNISQPTVSRIVAHHRMASL
jgi:hypothetical protein